MSRPVYGRYQVAEPSSALACLHLHKGEPLREVDHEPKVGVLDQSDLLAQGIRCATFIPGATDVDALGSCVYNANTAMLSNVLPEAEFLGITGASSYQDTVGAETFAIRSYHAGTDQTGDTATEWPPTDCGSSGVYAAQYDQRQGWISGQAVAHGAQNIVSLLQHNCTMQGTPFFFLWEEPDSHGFVDRNGTPEDIEAAIRSGVAGGHETIQSAIEKLALTRSGIVIPEQTIIRCRNSWSLSWGDHGSFRIHLSTLVMLGGNCDYRQLRK